MVLGCYYLTAENPKASKGAGRYFASLDDAIIAYEQKEVDLHSYVWVRFDGEVDTDLDDALEQEDKSADGIVTRLYKFRRVREDSDGNLISQYIKTTPGRIIYNKTVIDALAD
jgi:DNA-directed RNA polymerase subunit beta'